MIVELLRPAFGFAPGKLDSKALRAIGGDRGYIDLWEMGAVKLVERPHVKIDRSLSVFIHAWGREDHLNNGIVFYPGANNYGRSTWPDWNWTLEPCITQFLLGKPMKCNCGLVDLLPLRP